MMRQENIDFNIGKMMRQEDIDFNIAVFFQNKGSKSSDLMNYATLR